MRVLVVEDEFKTADFIRKGLLEKGIEVDVAHYGTDGLKQAQSYEYDVIILDIMLPGIDGWEVLRKLREKENMTPVIYLSALDGLQDRIQGLQLGADDYIVKPFEFSELVARIHTVLRRGDSKKQSEIYRVGSLELDLAAHRVVREGVSIELTPKEFTLLALLMRFKGDVLTRTRIAERIWNLDDFHDTNVVDVHMRRLRAKVDDPFERKLIHTVRGVGYTLVDKE
jgi:two-component system copper resistance phosphate regulon response regulator CusR